MQEDEVIDVEMPDSFIKSLTEEFLDLDSNFYIISIKNNEWRLYYGEKSILTITTTVNSSNDDEIVTVSQSRYSTEHIRITVYLFLFKFKEFTIIPESF